MSYPMSVKVECTPYDAPCPALAIYAENLELLTYAGVCNASD